MDDIGATLDKHWIDLKKYPNVLSVRKGFKRVGGKETNIPCITVFVSKKKPLTELEANDVVPKEIDGVPTDVVELDTKGDWEIGKTSVSQLHPETQRRLAGGVRKE